MFKIGDFSQMTRVTVKALRHYDRLGLLTPAHTDPESGYRYYTGGQLARLDRILALKELGFSLEQIGQLLDADLSCAQLRGMLLTKQGEVQGVIAAEQERLARIEARLQQIAGGEMPLRDDVTVKHAPAQRVASLHAVLPTHPAVGALFGELRAYGRQHGLHATTWTAIWRDGEYRESDIHVEATFATADPLPPHPRIAEGELPAAMLACIRHHGPMTTVGATHMALFRWIAAHGYGIAGPIRTLPLHLSDPNDEDGITEIQYPVAHGDGIAPPCDEQEAL